MGRRSDIPWNEIKTEYITTDTSYPKLADKYGVSARHLGQHGKSEGWVAEKSRYLSEKSQKIEEATTKEAVKKGLKAIRDIGDVACASIPIIRDKIAGASNGTQAEASVCALRALLLIVRDCYGILTAQENERVRIDREKLELEQKKYAEQTEERTCDIIVEVCGDRAEDYGL